MGLVSRGVMRWWLLMGSFPSVHCVAGMCKLDQVSPLSPGERSYHNQVRYAATSQQHDPSHGGHLLIFTCISWPLSFNISALEDEKYLNIKNILRACKVLVSLLMPDLGEQMSALCSKFRIPVSIPPFRGQGRHLRGYKVHPCYRFYGYGILFTICKF